MFYNVVVFGKRITEELFVATATRFININPILTFLRSRLAAS